MGRTSISEARGDLFLSTRPEPKFEKKLRKSKIRILVALLLSTGVAFLIHGYHPYAEDAEIYLPGVLKILNPRLFPTNSEFFGEHAGHSFYPNLIAFSVRSAHLPLMWVAFLWQLLSIFLLLAASLRLASALFGPEAFDPSRSDGEPSDVQCAHWGAVALMTALLTLPLAGTALYILDQFLNPRNLAAFSVLFAVAEVLHRKYGRATLWLVFGAAIGTATGWTVVGRHGRSNYAFSPTPVRGGVALIHSVNSCPRRG